MNTVIHSIEKNRDKDNVLILADKGHLKPLEQLFSDSELEFINSAAEKEVEHVLIPLGTTIRIVKFLPDKESLTQRKEALRRASTDLLNIIKNYKAASISILNYAEENLTAFLVEGLTLSNYQFLKYYTDTSQKENPLKEIHVHTTAMSASDLEQLRIMIEATCIARDLGNEPLSYLTAEQLAEEIKQLGDKADFSVDVFDKAKIESLNMGGLLAVNRGSFTPPSFSILEWKGTDAKNEKPIVLVGKGVVYDTGGVSLKPTANSMDFMKIDMAGAAVVIATLYAIAKLKLPLHVIGLVPATDNRPGNNAYVPGDVITMYSGKTVEVLNTDAEGRMILADALHYAKQYEPELVMDFATLTGSAARAIGTQGICYMGNADSYVKYKVEKSGFNVYERLVEFPMWEEYGEMIKSEIADIKNLGGPSAGMITAGKFLEHFTDYQWLHFDIAGASWLHSPDTYRGRQATGAGVRLMVDFLSNY